MSEAKQIIDAAVQDRGHATGLARHLKQLFRQLVDFPVRVGTGSSKHPWIQVRSVNWEHDHFPAFIRNAALDATYGPEFVRNREDPNAGNVTPHGIALPVKTWLEVIDKLGLQPYQPANFDLSPPKISTAALR